MTLGYDELTFYQSIESKHGIEEVRQGAFNNADNQTKDMMPGWEAFAIDGFATLDYEQGYWHWTEGCIYAKIDINLVKPTFFTRVR